MKSQKALNLSIIGALLVSTLACISIYLLTHFTLVSLPIMSFAIFGVVCFLFSFFIFHFLLNKYLYNRLKPIYRNLIQNKTDKYQITDDAVKPSEIADVINEKLGEWEEDKKEEISQLMKLEMFRKEFLGNVSHELKTPIFSVQGYVHTLLDGGIEDQDINLLYLKKATKSLDRLISIVDDLESVSKIEGGEMLLEKQTFEINEWVKDTMESLELMAKEKGVTLRIDSKTDKAFYVNADKNAIRQVLVNLIVNSIKYGSENGITEVSYTENQDLVLIHVKDNGIGISIEDQGRLFERFYRVDKSRSREQGGTGLGLAIVKHIVEAHGGKIGVSSEPGKGSTFSFSLEKV
ncbi:MAG: sensor histidine kinase [Bacteroidia bacterium]|nr:sensor histidine kinase [Bacteroidia bacterium]